MSYASESAKLAPSSSPASSALLDAECIAERTERLAVRLGSLLDRLRGAMPQVGTNLDKQPPAEGLLGNLNLRHRQTQDSLNIVFSRLEEIEGLFS